MKLKTKIFLVLIAFSILPVLLTSTGLLSIMFRASTGYSGLITDYLSQFVASDIERFTDQINQSLEKISVDYSLQQYIDVPLENTTDQAYYLLAIRPLTEYFLRTNPDVASVLYLDQLGKMDEESLSRSGYWGIDFKSDSVYKQVFLQNEKLMIPPHLTQYNLSGRDDVFSYVFPVANMKSRQNQAWLVAEIQTSRFMQILHQYSTGDKGIFFLYDPKSKTVFPNDKYPLPQRQFEEFIQANVSTAGLEERTSAQVVKIGQSSFEFTLTSLPTMGWKLVCLAPMEEISHGLQYSRILIWLISFISLLIAWTMAYPFMSRLLRPLTLLRRAMIRTRPGSYQKVTLSTGRDEISYVLETYNHMIDDLKLKEEEITESRMREKEKEVLQLQAQVNPHFFFNVLETMSSFAAKNQGDAVAAMIKSIGRMMRYNIRQDGGWAALHEEIKYIGEFLDIHSYRMGKKVPTTIVVDKAVENVPILKLSIQPFVENALKYAWHPEDEQFRLKIQCKLQDSQLHVLIVNNGMPMPEEVLRILRETISGQATDNPDFFRGHIGIINVYRRLSLAYGQAFQLTISAPPEGGTEVNIRIDFTNNVG
ncbi:cache domain-containing sensor histidine kinase [Paenibacillus pectinilyticus]|nr:sensor histidine kinase [Paenibacillus pectinilyticus]